MGVEAGRGEFRDHLQKSILTHKKDGEENQREVCWLVGVVFF